MNAWFRGDVVMLMGVAVIVLLCIVAYTLATYALPLMLGLTTARFAYHTGSGQIGADFRRASSPGPSLSPCWCFCSRRCDRRSCGWLLR
jgi:hypothetical protein